MSGSAQVSVREKNMVDSQELVIMTTNEENNKVDAADFLLSNSNYHDCVFTVGNPDINGVEKIAVTSAYLVANSPVFRQMIKSYKQSQTVTPDCGIVVTDISPATFKHMLRFLYGGKLPEMTSIEIAQLALCADKFKITRLVNKTLKRLYPTNAENVLTALICVTYATFPDLEDQVSKIIQHETDKIVESANFLNLDEECVLFILKQTTLNIGEVALWNSIVRWAEHKVEKNPTINMWDCLKRILQYVRLLTISPEEILEHVLLKEILPPDEIVDLTIAVKKKQELRSSFLCKIREKRSLCNEEEVDGKITKQKGEASEHQGESQRAMFNKSHVFIVSDYSDFLYLDKHKASSCSTIHIKPKESIEIQSFTCRGRLGNGYDVDYSYNCEITMTKTTQKSICKQSITLEGTADFNDEIVLPLKFESGLDIVMNPQETWTFELKFENKYPNYKLLSDDDTWGKVDVTCNPIEKDSIVFEFGGPLHVLEVAYKTQN